MHPYQDKSQEKKINIFLEIIFNILFMKKEY